MANINANEIERQAGRLDSQNIVFATKVRDIIDNLTKIAETVSSNDSGLTNEINKLATNYRLLENKLSSNFKNLAIIMHDYSKKSLSLDQSITSDVKTSNSNLDKIASELSSIAGLPEFYVDFD